MFYNGANCDIYVGTGAGKKLLNDLAKAQRSIKIVSPYLSPPLIKQLIRFRKRNVDVELITCDDIEDFYGSYDKNIFKLLEQNRVTDERAVEIRKKWEVIYKVLIYVGTVFLIFSMGIGFYSEEIKVAFALFPITFLFLAAKHYRTKIKNKRIYSYWYSQLFPFKVYKTPARSNKSGTFIHSKIYLIDDQIAYMGSLNFTVSGTKYNYETRIRTTDPDALKEIKKEIFQLMNNSHLPEKDIQAWGSQLYPEPIN